MSNELWEAYGLSQRPRPAQAAVGFKIYLYTVLPEQGAASRRCHLRKTTLGLKAEETRDGMGRPLGTANLVSTFFGGTDQVE